MSTLFDPFQFEFFRIRYFVSGMSENFEAIVLEGIMGCRDHKTGRKGTGFGEPRDGGGRQYPSEFEGDALALQTGANLGRARATQPAARYR